MLYHNGFLGSGEEEKIFITDRIRTKEKWKRDILWYELKRSSRKQQVNSQLTKLSLCNSKKQSNTHNWAMLVLQTWNVTIYSTAAQDQLVGATRSFDNIDSSDSIPDNINKTGGFTKKLQPFMSAKVMLRSDTEQD